MCIDWTPRFVVVMTRVKKPSTSRRRHNLYSSSGSGYNKNNNSTMIYSMFLVAVSIILCYLFVNHRHGGDAVSRNGIPSSEFHKGRFRGNSLRPRPRNDGLSQDEDGEPDLADDLEKFGGQDDNFDLSRKKELKLAEDIFKGRGDEVPSGDSSGDFGDEIVERKEYTFDTSLVMFQKYHKGKSGTVVEEMLMAHAYVFQQNATYGGCCGSKTVKMAAHEELLEAIGLKGVLKFQCPNDLENDHKTRRSVISRDRYTSDDIRVWTPEYVDYLRSLLMYPPKQHKEYTIVVHLLRGDTSPCKPKQEGYYRYLPNVHYQTLIDKYMQPGARVIIYTSPKSFEDLSEFRRRGYEVITDAPLRDTWKDFVTADVLIMSRSDFTMVPAMVAKGKVVYTPFWHHSLRRWKRVSKQIMGQTEEEIERLRRERCQIAID